MTHPTHHHKEITVKRYALPLTALLVLPLAACGSDMTTTPEPSTAASSAASATASEPSAADQVDAAAPVAPASPTTAIFAFGETSTCNDAAAPYTFVLAAPAEYEPSEYYSEDITGTPVKIDVTVTNTGTGVLDPSLMYLSAASGGVEAASQFDSAAGLEGAPSTPLLPGQSTTFGYGFDVADPANIVVEAGALGMACNSAIYTNVALG